MTPQEFKAWFDGFTEAVDKAPTQKQWARIKERVAEIDGKPVTEKIYVDRYLPTYHPIYTQPYRGPYYSPIWCSTSAQNIASCTLSNDASGGSVLSSSVGAFDSLAAMCALGQADAAALNS